MKFTAKLSGAGGSGDPFDKIRNLRNLNYMFEQLPGHVANYLHGELVNDELNYGYDDEHIGRISHNLADGVIVEIKPYEGKVVINGDGRAPYAEDVSNWAKNKYGYNPKESVLRRTTETVMQTVADEWKRAAKTIERGGNYTYDNPFTSLPT